MATRYYKPYNARTQNNTQSYTSQPLIIHDKRWYFRLTPRGPEEGRASRPLMEDYNINDIASHLVICFSPRTISGKNGPQQRPDGGVYHLFAYFDSYLEFFAYIWNFPTDQWSFYEMIFAEFPQKPHFDIDIKKKDLDLAYPGSDIEDVAVILKDAVITGCLEVLADLKVSIDITRDILLYTSHGNEAHDIKRSFHLIITNKCHEGNKEAKAFYEAVMLKVKVITNNKFTDFVDKSVYSPRQQFRIVGSQKPGSGRMKIFNELFAYKEQNYRHIYPEFVSNDPGDAERMKFRVITYESLVTFTNGCNYLPSLIPERPTNSLSYANLPDLDDKLVDCCLKMMKARMPGCPFSFLRIAGHVISLKREAPSICPICNKRHENENPFLFIIDGKVYWDCRRSDSGVKKFFIGYITIDDTYGTKDKLKLGGTAQIPANNDDAVEEEDTQEFGGNWGFNTGKIGTTLIPTVPSVSNISESKAEAPKSIKLVIKPPNQPVGPDYATWLPIEQRQINPQEEMMRLAKAVANAKANKVSSESVGAMFARSYQST